MEQDSRLAIAPFSKAGGNRPVPALSSKGTMVCSDATLKLDREKGFWTSNPSKAATPPLRTPVRAHPAAQVTCMTARVGGSAARAGEKRVSGFRMDFLEPGVREKIEFDLVEKE